MTAIKWTDSQKIAIDTWDRPVMVGASAGTGKTAVLARRCAQIIAAGPEGGADVSQMLVLTFTEAAADEMRTRIAKQLWSEYRQKRGKDRRLRQQLLLLDGADISTIHSFCRKIIAENFHLLGIDPAFRVIDPDEQNLLKNELLNDTIEQSWQDESIRRALPIILSGRDLATAEPVFLRKILRISEYLDSIPDVNSWYSRAEQINNIDSPEAAELVQTQKQLLIEQLNMHRERVLHALKLNEKFNGPQKFDDYFNDVLLAEIDKCMSLLHEDNFAQCFEIISEFTTSRFPSVRNKEFDKEILDLIKSPAKEAKDKIKGLCEWAVINKPSLRMTASPANLLTNVLVELTKRFRDSYEKAKHKLNCVDFADLEHLALRLLTSDDGQTPGPTALAMQKRYKFILVDEYQDVNRVQQRILDCIGPGENIFGVGDVKQSIYAWRQAEPAIFLNKIASATEDARHSGPEKQKLLRALRVDLRDNFRSREQVLEFVNLIFSKIMSAQLGGIEYDSSAMLVAGFEYTQTNDKLIELHILNENADSDEDAEEGNGEEGSRQAANEEPDAEFYAGLSSTQRQAMVIAKRIRKMVQSQEFEVYDRSEEKYRPVNYGDVVVLMRSLSRRVNEYIEVFRLVDVPVNAAGSSGYFETTEITDCVCLLKVLDNPRRDIELAALLRSPLLNVSDTELAAVRSFASKPGGEYETFFDAVNDYIRKRGKEEEQNKIASAMEKIYHWRKLTRGQSLADTLWQILRETGYLSFVAALPNGKTRRANLLKMHERAIQFENFAGSSRTVSLARFVRFVERLRQQERDWASAQPAGPCGAAVRIMSIHKSKGLEFPVVFLAETGSTFNLRDTSDDILLDADITMGVRVVDSENNIKLPAISHQIISQKKIAASLDEEMRILYVALTRARERLIICGAMKQNKCEKIVGMSVGFDENNVPVWQLNQCRSTLQWLLYALADNTAIRDNFATASERKPAKTDDLLDVHVYNKPQLQKICEQINELQISRKKQLCHTRQTLPPGSRAVNLANNISDKLKWRYRHESSTRIPAKTSVTAVAHNQQQNELPVDEFSRFDFADAFDNLKMAASNDKTVEPKQIGTAAHLVMENLEFREDIDTEYIREVIEGLVEQKLILPEVAECVDIAKLLTFFKSDLGRLAIENCDSLHREWMFTYGMNGELLEGGAADETIVLQGIIDLLIETAEGLVIVDYKTDNVHGPQIAERAESYSQQIKLYAKAASDILQKPVKSTWLYFLRPGREIQIS